MPPGGEVPETTGWYWRFLLFFHSPWTGECRKTAKRHWKTTKRYWGNATERWGSEVLGSRQSNGLLIRRFRDYWNCRNCWNRGSSSKSATFQVRLGSSSASTKSRKYQTTVLGHAGKAPKSAKQKPLGGKPAVSASTHSAGNWFTHGPGPQRFGSPSTSSPTGTPTRDHWGYYTLYYTRKWANCNRWRKKEAGF